MTHKKKMVDVLTFGNRQLIDGKVFSNLEARGYKKIAEYEAGNWGEKTKYVRFGLYK
jgi:hypothetical protein